MNVLNITLDLSCERCHETARVLGEFTHALNIAVKQIYHKDLESMTDEERRKIIDRLQADAKAKFPETHKLLSEKHEEVVGLFMSHSHTLTGEEMVRH